MGIGDLFGSRKIETLQLKVKGQEVRIKELTDKLEQAGKVNQDLMFKISKQEELLTPEMQDSALLQIKINKQKAELAQLQIENEDLVNKNNRELMTSRQLLEDVKNELDDLRKQLIITEDEILVQSFGLYTPKYSLMSSEEYKNRLNKNRSMQKELIKAKTAATGSTTWTVNGSASKGKKMVADTQKLLLRAFNAECDDVIDHVKYNNIESAEKRIAASRDAISKLGEMMNISISSTYYKLKIEELYLAFEFQQKKQEEKEAQKEARAKLREEAKLAKEIEAQRIKLEKEQNHYQNALNKILLQIDLAPENERADIEEKRLQIEEQLRNIDKAFAEVDYRAANQKAGYVYIISNIGAFGENVFKIGMTRRLDPMERVDELGDASVPFDFDVHAMIFSENAPALETALHHAFEDRKLNMVNTRREFFRVSLDEIKNVVKKNYDKTVEFFDVPMAEQFRQSELMRSSK